jgi:hypothetical protein
MKNNQTNKLIIHYNTYLIVGSIGNLFHCGGCVGLHFLLHLSDFVTQSCLITLLGG